MADQKIIPNLWFNKNAQEAVDFYVSIFPESKITNTAFYPTEGIQDFQKDFAGKERAIEFELGGFSFVAINAGNEFSINPSISCFINFDPKTDDKAEAHLIELWDHLIEDGTALMELGEYPFSKKYGWVQDKYGMSWQLILTNPEGEDRPFIIPSMLFVSEEANKCEEAFTFYAEVFKDSHLGTLARYGQAVPDRADSIMFGDVNLDGEWIAGMDGGPEHSFSFNEAVSLAVLCKDQAEIDYFWDNLSSDPKSEMCGWCKDQFGVSWQVIPANVEELMDAPGGFEKMMTMKKIEMSGF